MKKNDQEILAQLYEEGVWDRMKASASGVAGGVKGFLGGRGYAKSAQASKYNSLMSNSIRSILKDVQKLKSDISKYPNASISDKIDKIEKILSSY